MTKDKIISFTIKNFDLRPYNYANCCVVNRFQTFGNNFETFEYYWTSELILNINYTEFQSEYQKLRDKQIFKFKENTQLSLEETIKGIIQMRLNDTLKHFSKEL